MHVKLITFKLSDAELHSKNDEKKYNCILILEK